MNHMKQLFFGLGLLGATAISACVVEHDETSQIEQGLCVGGYYDDAGNWVPPSGDCGGGGGAGGGGGVGGGGGSDSGCIDGGPILISQTIAYGLSLFADARTTSGSAGCRAEGNCGGVADCWAEFETGLFGGAFTRYVAECHVLHGCSWVWN